MADGAKGRLERYQAMRDFGTTPEPSGTEEVAPHPDGLPRFVIQEHHATSLHWDLRFERDGVLPSWAVPRGLPPDPRQNHLAIHTEDHPLMYLEFSGDIPAGHYGAGSMTIWDRGTYETEKWSENEVMVVLHGERARGRYVLFRTGASKSGQEQWMIHRMDPPDDPERQPLPEGLSPMLATPSKTLPPDPDGRWAYEVKWDGIRSLVTVWGGRVKIEARSGNDVTERYPELAALGRSMGTTQAVLDGEIVAFDPATGRPSFERLQRRMHVTSESAIRRLRHDVPVVYAIFDLLWLEGRSLMGLPYADRRRALDHLGLKGPAWQVPASHVGDGELLMEAVRAQGLEGVVAKRLDSTYEPGVRSKHWLKVKNLLSQEFVIGGWLPGEGSRTRLGALLLGVHDDAGRLVFAGRVGTGFTDKEIDRLMALLTPRLRDDPPFDPMPPRGTIPVREAKWVEPELVAEVAFTEWTNVGILRHPSYKGLRDEHDASEVIRET